MISGWDQKQLGEVIERVDTIDPTRTPNKPFKYVDVSSVSNITFEIEEVQELLGKDAPSRARRHIRRGDVLFATVRPALKRIAVVPDELDGEVCSTGYFVFRTKPYLDSRFVFYYLMSPRFIETMELIQTGASYPAVNDAQVKSQIIHYPSLYQQKRIVAILDEAFEGIAKAAANAERNLSNARELFVAVLAEMMANPDRITAAVPNWVEITVDEAIRSVPVTEKIQRKDFLNDGQFPIISQESNFVNGYWNDVSALFRVREPVVIFGDHTKILKFVDFDFVRGADGVKILSPKPGIDPKFFYYALMSKPIRSLGYARHYRLLAQTQFSYPLDVDEQRRIVERLDRASETVKNLEAVLKEKVFLLSELRQTLLNKAFSGQLTAKEAIVA